MLSQPIFLEGLTKFSEQTAEAAHADFDGYWQRYKVRDVNHPNLGKNLLREHENSDSEVGSAPPMDPPNFFSQIPSAPQGGQHLLKKKIF